MARRTPFPFADHKSDDCPVPSEKIDAFITAYEEALRTEYVAGDIDVASYHEGLREAYESVLVDLLGIDHDLLDAYWKRGPHAEPATFDLPFTGGNQLIDYGQVEAWSGRRLDADQWERLNGAIPHSTIPETVALIVSSIVNGD